MDFGDNQSFICVKDAIGDLYANKPTKNSEYLISLNNINSGLSRSLKNKLSDYDNAPNFNKRTHSPDVQDRFRLYQLLHKHGIKNNIFNRAANDEFNKDQKLEAELQPLFQKLSRYKSLRANDGIVVAHNKDELLDKIKKYATKKHSQYPLAENKLARAVLTIPDDVVHPIEARTMTVREQARFQSFPDNFEFRSKETTGGHLRKFQVPQYSQVGNAVPPLLALAIGKKLKPLLRS